MRSKADGMTDQLDLAHGPETKKIRKKIKSKKPSSSEETVQAKVRGGSPGGRSETTGVSPAYRQNLCAQLKLTNGLRRSVETSNYLTSRVPLVNSCLRRLFFTLPTARKL